MENVTRALVIEDSPDDFELYCRLLRKKGVNEIIHHVSAEKAFHFLKNQNDHEKYDIVFLDYNLPRMSGIDFLRKLKKEHIDINSPIIVLTGHGDESVIGSFIELNVSDYLRKDSLNIHSLETSIQKARRQYALRKIETEKQKELLLFAHTLAHDLKNPIARIRSYSTLCSKNHKKLKEYLNYIHEDATFLVDFIDKLLMYAEFGRKVEEKERLSFKKILEKSIEMVEVPRLEKKAIIEIPETIPMIYGSEMALVQLFQNLLSNSIKYCAQRPHISIEITTKDKEIIVFFKDNGIGIPEDAIKNIFKPFYRAENSLNASGTGLGLAIVKSIADHHDAYLEISSIPQGGTQIMIRFCNQPSTKTSQELK